MNHDVEAHGFTLIAGVIGEDERREVIAQLGPVSGAGRRGLLAQPTVSTLARSPRLLDLVRPHLAAEPFPVRAIYFDKSTDANWLVPWHQDLTLALRETVDVPGFGPWSVKDGIPFPARPLSPALHIQFRTSLDPAPPRWIFRGSINFLLRLCQDAFYHLRWLHTGEAEIETLKTIRQPLVIDPEQM